MSVTYDLGVIAGLIDMYLREKPRIVIEAPPGFKHIALEIARRVKGEIAGRPVWGACDITMDYRGCPLLIIHLGHKPPPPVTTRLCRNLKLRRRFQIEDCEVFEFERVIVGYVPVYYKAEPRLVERLVERLKGLGEFDIVYPINYRLYARRICEALKAEFQDGLLTGCHFGFRLNHDVVIAIAGGYFHALTVKLLHPNVRVYVADPFRGTIENVEGVYRRLMALYAKARLGLEEARLIGVIRCLKPGQFKEDSAETALRLLRQKGKEALIVDLDEISPEYLNDLPFDAYVNTACPRIGFDDLDRVYRPVVNLGGLLGDNILHWP